MERSSAPVELLDGPAHHHLDDLLAAHLADGPGGDLLSVPHDRDAVGDPEDLGKMVGDVDDRDAAAS